MAINRVYFQNCGTKNGNLVVIVPETLGVSSGGATLTQRGGGRTEEVEPLCWQSVLPYFIYVAGAP